MRSKSAQGRDIERATEDSMERPVGEPLSTVATGAGTTLPAMGRPQGGIAIQNLSKVYERASGRQIVRTHALRKVDLEVRPQEFVSLIGPSGCGKTTVLKIVAGLLKPSGGDIAVDGRAIHGPGTDRGVVFQQAALLPWQTVHRNVTIALQFAKVPKGERQERADRYLELVGLADFHKHYPGELSGGMQQRVGIARALALEPKVLLMDEPFGALDAITRHHMQHELVRIWGMEKKSVLFVTHSLDEAMLLSDRIVVMTRGGVAGDVKVDVDRPRDRAGLLENAEARRLRLQLESMLVEEEVK
jgi:NitT/TauT family transport system ATP-binding protein